MCLDPATLTTLSTIATISSTASGVIGTIASYSQEQATYGAQMAAYQRSEEAYKQQLELNAQAANRAYESEQLKLQGEFMKASQEAQGKLAQSLRTQGSVLASGRSGQSIGLLMSDAEREYGRDFANLAQNLAFARQDYFVGAEDIYQKQKSANAIAASNRMLEPTAPGAIGLVSGLAQAGLSGLSTYTSLAAKPATVPQPQPKPTN